MANGCVQFVMVFISLFISTSERQVMTTPVCAICENKDVDQLAHQHRLISVFAVRCLDSIIPIIAISEITRLLLACVAEQTSLSYLVAHLLTKARL